MKFLILLTITLSPIIATPSVPISTQSIQLQQLIRQSERQIESLQEIINYSKKETATLDKALRVLENLTLGIDESIQQYKGTDIYERALLRLQMEDEFSRTFTDSEQVRMLTEEGADQAPGNKMSTTDISEFQKQSVKANQAALDQIEELKEHLSSVQPGIVPKIQAQIQLSTWQSNTQLSMQLTEIISVIHAIREEMRLLRTNNENQNTWNQLVIGSEIQNKKHLQEMRP